MKFFDTSELSLLNKTKVKIRSNSIIHWSRESFREFLVEVGLPNIVTGLDRMDFMNDQEAPYGHFVFNSGEATVTMMLDGICSCGNKIIRRRSLTVVGEEATDLNNAILVEITKPEVVPK